MQILVTPDFDILSGEFEDTKAYSIPQKGTQLNINRALFFYSMSTKASQNTDHAGSALI